MRVIVRSILCVSLISFFPLLAFAQPTANFSASTTSGCSPIVVNFTDLSTGSPTSWSWDLGNGTTSTLQNPSTTYTLPGTYTVVLTATNSGGSNTKTITNYITVTASPTVGFTADSTAKCPPYNITFTNSSTAGTGTVSYAWDFGDGYSSTATNPSHIYATAGTYNVTLVATNSSGCTKTLVKSSYIQMNARPAAAFTASSTSSCSTPFSVTFNNSSTSAASYAWDFGDGGTSTSTSPTHSYSSTGSYTVRLIATNSAGCSDTELKASYININTFTAGFTKSVSTACSGTSISFTNTSTSGYASSKWDFGDGGTATTTNATHAYTTSGSYTVKLVVSNGSCADSTTQTVTINALPVVSFTADTLSSCKSPQVVNFTNATTGATSYNWTFGDGGTSTATNPSHSYSGLGSYFTVKLRATSVNGCVDSSSRSAYISLLPVTGSITANPTGGCVPATINFSKSLSATIASYTWRFGDGGTSTTSLTPSHTYSSAGTYTVKFVFQTATGCVDSFSTTVTVSSKPTASFTASPRSVCTGASVSFSNGSSGATSYLWDFGDGVTSTNTSPTHSYNSADSFTVRLIASNGSCSDTMTRVKYIAVKGPYVHFSPQIYCDNRLKVFFTNFSTTSHTSYSWSFGDATSSTAYSPNHTYSSYGTRNVTLSVYDTVSGCTNTETRQVTTFPLTSAFSASDSVVCKGASITFTGPTNPDYSSYTWIFGDASTSTTTTNTTTHSYSTTGTYTVKLVVLDDIGCTDTTTKTNYIHIGGPNVSFRADPINSCIGTTINFYDSSTDAVTITSRRWVWGDGSVLTGNSTTPTHSYALTGLFTVKLVVRDTAGCTDSVSRSGYVNIDKPTALFNASDTLICPGLATNFTNSSVGAATYLWDFGDGNTSTSANPSHAYVTGGYYTVRLIATNAYGCKDTITKTNYIHVIMLNLGFNMSDSVANCPPLSVIFTNTSSGIVSYAWSFGNGGFSVTTSPTSIYTYPGVYKVWLRGTNAAGCTDSIYKTVTINGPRGSLSYSPVSGCSPLTVSFTSTDTSTSTITWDMNNGTTVTNITSSPTTSTNTYSYTFTSPGRYVPLIVITNAAACTIYIRGIDTIKVDEMQGDFRFTPDSLCGSGTVSFFDTVLYSLSSISSYNWSFGDATTTTGHNPTHTYTSAGTYTVRLIMTNGTGCSDTITKTVHILSLPNVNAGADRSLCGGAAGVTLTATGATTYSWSPTTGLSCSNCASPTAAPSSTTTYVVTGTDTHGCTNTDTVVVRVSTLPNVNAGADKTICAGSSTSLTATGAATYTWTPSTGLSCTACSNPTASPTVTTTYIVTGVDTNGCSKNDTVIVNVKPLPNVNAGPDKVICNGGSTTLNGSGASTYSWSPATGLSCTGCATPTATPTTTTTYVLTGTDTNSCVKTDTVIVRVNPLPNVSAGPDRTICVGSSATLSGSGASIYSWSPATGLSCTGCATPTASPTTTTTYVLTGTDTNGCVKTDTVVVKVNALPTVSAGADRPICIGSSTTLTATGASTYTWTPSTGLSCSACSNPTASPTVTTTYIVTGTDTNGCVKNDTVIVRVNPLPIVSAGADKTICNGSSTTLTATGASTYSWSPATGLSCATCASTTASPSSTTSYVVTGTDTNGCVNKDTVIVNVKPLPSVSAGADKSICIGGSVSLSATGASSYTWTPSTGLSCTACANPTASPTVTTTYIVTGTDTNSCVKSDTVIVTVNPLPPVSAGPDQSVCSGIAASLTATGASSYVWTPATGLSCTACANPTATPASTTSYIVTGTDSKGCVKSDTVVVTIKPLPSVAALSNTAICNGASAKLKASGAVTYVWSPASGLSCTACDSTIASPTVTTTYVVTGTGANGCTDTGRTTVTVYPLPTITLNHGDTTLCYGSSIQLNATGANTYIWTPAGGLSCTTCPDPLVSSAITTTYVVTGTDIHGCVATASIKITVIDKGPTSVGPGDTLCQGESVALFASGGTAYLWIPSTGLSSNNVYNPTATPDTTTIYTVIIKQGDCFADTAIVPIYVNPIPTVTAEGTQTILTGSSAQLFARGKNILTYEWSPAFDLSCSDCPGPIASPKKTTTYTVTVTGEGGCKASGDVTVTVTCDDNQLFIPNTFTPNGDGLNDRFYPSGKGVGTVKRFAVYNRWGEIVFERENMPLNDPNAGWDGTYKGSEAKPDVFVYIVDAECDNGQPIKIKGDVSLVR